MSAISRGFVVVIVASADAASAGFSTEMKTPLCSDARKLRPRSVSVTSNASVRSHALGPFTEMAIASRSCSGVSCATIAGALVAVGVPKLPSRSSVAPERKKLRQVPFSAPYPSCSSVSA